MARLFTKRWQDEEPVFINDEGFSWYIQEDLTEYAQDDAETLPGVPINAACFIVVKDQKPITYAIVMDDALVYENQNYEATAFHIDVLRLVGE